MVTGDYSSIYNGGERLIPGLSHDLQETVRHKSSYKFFREIITADLETNPGLPVRILDLGCGVGHGTNMLSAIENSSIIGIDISTDAIDYARENYDAQNIGFIPVSASDYIGQDEPFDYIVSRHCLEHVEGGIDLALRFNCSRRLMVNVPYLEQPGNVHHKVHRIDEGAFHGYDNAEFFFEGLDGSTYEKKDVNENTNSIICVRTFNDAERIADLVSFPVPPWKPDLLERIVIEHNTTLNVLSEKHDELRRSISQFEGEAQELIAKVEKYAKDLESARAEMNEMKKHPIYRILNLLRRS